MGVEIPGRVRGTQGRRDFRMRGAAPGVGVPHGVLRCVFRRHRFILYAKGPPLYTRTQAPQGRDGPKVPGGARQAAVGVPRAQGAIGSRLQPAPASAARNCSSGWADLNRRPLGPEATAAVVVLTFVAFGSAFHA